MFLTPENLVHLPKEVAYDVQIQHYIHHKGSPHYFDLKTEGEPERDLSQDRT